MPGLLDFLSNIKYEPNALSQGLLSMGANMLASSGPSTTPVSFGQSLGQGLLGFQQGAGAFQQQELARKLQELQLASQTPEAQRNKIMTEALARSEAEKLYPKAPSIPTGFTRGEGGAITPMPIAGPGGPTDYMGYQMEMARQRAQIPGYGEPQRLGMEAKRLQLQEEQAKRAEEVSKKAQLTNIPPAQIDSQLGNIEALRKIDNALAEIDKSESSLGIKNYVMPDIIAQRLDPGGVKVRGAIADIAGQKIHAMSGSAVTLSESERLKPYIPQPTDTPSAAREKLNILRDEYENLINQRANLFIQEKGYKGYLPLYEKQGNVTMDFKGGLSPEDKATIEADKAKSTPEGWTDQEEAEYQQFLKSRGGK